MSYIKIKLNIDLGKYKKDSILKIKVDDKGAPLERYWRSRLNDSKKDNCVEVITESNEPTNNTNKKKVK